MRAWGITDIGCVRAQNQDAYRIETPLDGCVCAAICDGMGGARAGDLASRLAVDAFMDAVLRGYAAGLPENPEELLCEAVTLGNRVVWERALADVGCMGMGTTLVAALAMPDGTVHLINVGDSRAYQIGGGGICKITRDHSVVEEMVERGEITAEEARMHPRKNLITRVVGSEETVTGDLYRVEPGEGFLLLCSDGLSNVLSDQEMLFEVLHGGEPEDCCDRLLSVALTRGAPDNVTAVLLAL